MQGETTNVKNENKLRERIEKQAVKLPDTPGNLGVGATKEKGWVLLSQNRDHQTKLKPKKNNNPGNERIQTLKTP